MALNFEWNDNKNRANRKKHGIWFEEAISVFGDKLGRLFYDEKHSDNEDRYILMGLSNSQKLLVIVHLYMDSGNRIRIISARPATDKERTFYEEGI